MRESAYPANHREPIVTAKRILAALAVTAGLAAGIAPAVAAAAPAAVASAPTATPHTWYHM